MTSGAHPLKPMISLNVSFSEYVWPPELFTGASSARFMAVSMSTIPDDVVGASISSMLAVFLTNIADEEEEEEEEEEDEAARVEFFFRAKEAGAMADRAVSEVNIASVVLVLVIFMCEQLL
jgi:hypothetical protein